MARKIIIVGNWKMNKIPSEAKKFMVQFNKLVIANKAKIKNMKFGIGAPAVSLATVKKLAPTGMIVAAENFNEHISGAFTGELSATMIKSVGANAVIIGHSERRAMYNETDQSVNAKMLAALENKLLPIVCVGETLQQRKSGKWKATIKIQLINAFKDLTGEQTQKVIIAYEPIWAIGTGVTASSSQAQEVCAYIRNLIGKIFSELVSSKIIIQYGGSVKPDNIAELMAKKDIDGALVGGGSLEADSFVKLLTLNQ
ncbi:triose-phosphate isomerase [Candidatus Mycoplasma mahonii]|uniref:triose-phosphate isomerase n=1 Tax=Candidatus Mycoplasma mahonii TaxID=3004105 RepID=UPI0026EEE741|nr:triose-phosphate isomerase [Candidatus Mycoplasma mahonii]WKX02351.1 triose-phosphate isomerase [Candidatus Mycoplasma mahonii]